MLLAQLRQRWHHQTSHSIKDRKTNRDIVVSISIVLANPESGYYPGGNISIKRRPFTSDTLSQSLSIALSSSAGTPAQLSFGHSQIRGTESSASNGALSFTNVAPYPYPSKYPSRGPLLSAGDGSLPKASDWLSTGRNSNTTITDLLLSPTSPLTVSTGGYYPAGNASASDINPSRYVTGSTAQTTSAIASATCIVNAISAEVYGWDSSGVNFTQCPKLSSKACAFQSITAPYSPGSQATRAFSAHYPRPSKVPVLTNASNSTASITGLADPTHTKTRSFLDDISHAKLTHVEEDTLNGPNSTYMVSQFSYTTRPVSHPNDVSQSDMKTNGYTFTAIYPTSYVLYSVFEIERLQAGTGLFPSRATSTSTFTAPIPFIEPYTSNPVGSYHGPSATGPINNEAVRYFASEGANDILGCAVGSFRGTRTAIVPSSTRYFPILVNFYHTTVHVLTPTKTTTRHLMTEVPVQVLPLIDPIPIEGQSSSAVRADDGGPDSSRPDSNYAPKGEPGSINGHRVSLGASGQASAQGSSQRGSQSSPQDDNQNTGKGGSSEENSQKGSQSGPQGRPQDGNQSEPQQSGSNRESSGLNGSQKTSQSGT